LNPDNTMPEPLESPKPRTADEIAELADAGEDISRFFTGNGKMMPPMPSLTEEEDRLVKDVTGGS
jgi:hypothetical protein